MSAAQQQAGQAQATTSESGSLLDQVIGATKATERSRTEELLKTLADEALKGTVTYSKNVTQTIKQAMAGLDQELSKQLAAVLHHPDFQKLEGTWRGLHHLVMNSETSTNLKIKVFNVSKKELFKDVDKAVEFDQSQIFKKLYENEFGSPGGEPYGSLIGDYEFSNHPDDVSLLEKMSTSRRRLSARSSPLVRPSCSASTVGTNSPSRATWRRSSTPSNTPSGVPSGNRKMRASSPW